MDCHYVAISVKNDAGMDKLIETVIEQCINLENQVSGSISSSKTGTDGIFTIGGSDGLTSGDVKNINPMKLEFKKKGRGCCGQ